AFGHQALIYKVKKEQPASKRQKEHLQDLLKYHKIVLSVQTEYLSRNEISRITDKIIAQYGRI
ncbi:MAG TPA: DNA polymerase III subunit epsilon, partial [Lachnoclostridium sp.]|nr:DNA polymerase III subunit epsilon [Lachnoclostridium sp.]